MTNIPVTLEEETNPAKLDEAEVPEEEAYPVKLD